MNDDNLFVGVTIIKTGIKNNQGMGLEIKNSQTYIYTAIK